MTTPHQPAAQRTADQRPRQGRGRNAAGREILLAISDPDRSAEDVALGYKHRLEGGYEPIAERVFNEVAVDRVLLEYDDERSGSFEPLRFVAPGKTVVLGLVSSKPRAGVAGRAALPDRRGRQ